ncbi:hypothetical protein ACWDTD_07745 [Gordonia sp. NPDC003425]
MSAPTNTAIDVDAFHALGAATSQAFADGHLDLNGLAQVCRHVLDLDLGRARAVLSQSPKAITAQHN